MSYEERGKRSKGAWKVLSSWQEGLSFVGPGSVFGTPCMSCLHARPRALNQTVQHPFTSVKFLALSLTW